MTANTEIHSLLQDLAVLGEEQNLGPVMVERIKRAGEWVGASPWQHIDGAPKDGSYIDVWFENERRPDVYWGFPNHSCGEAGPHCDNHPSRSDWCDCYGYLSEDGDKSPTYWRRIPSAPPALDTAARVGDDARIVELRAKISELTKANEELGDWRDRMIVTAEKATAEITGLRVKLASIPTPTGRAEALEDAAKVCGALAKEYDADAKRMTGTIVLARADQGATTAVRLAMMIRALASAPTQADRKPVCSSYHSRAVGVACSNCGHKKEAHDREPTQTVTVDDAAKIDRLATEAWLKSAAPGCNEGREAFYMGFKAAALTTQHREE